MRSPAVSAGTPPRPLGRGCETSLENLALLCSRHHRVVHDRGHTIERGDGGELLFRDDRGVRLLAAPPALQLPADPCESLAHDQRHLGIHENTIGCCNGDRVDYEIYEMVHDALARAAGRRRPDLAPDGT